MLSMELGDTVVNHKHASALLCKTEFSKQIFGVLPSFVKERAPLTPFYIAVKVQWTTC